MKQDQNEFFLLRELATFASMTNALRQKKVEFHNQVLEKKIIEANYYISKQLEIPLASKLFYLKRLRVIEGKPCSIEKTYIRYDLVKGLEEMEFEDQSFYEVLEAKTGIKTIKSQEEILIVEANDVERELLELEQGDEIVLIKGITFKDENNPFEYFELTSIPSFYRFRSVSNI